MNTKNIDTINIKIEEYIEKLLEYEKIELEKFIKWLKDYKGFIKNLNKKIWLFREDEEYIFVPIPKEFNTVFFYETDVEKIKNDTVFNFLNLKWKLPKLKEIIKLFEYEDLFINSKSYYIRFKNLDADDIAVDIDGELWACDRAVNYDCLHDSEKYILPIIRFNRVEDVIEFMFKEGIEILDYEIENMDLIKEICLKSKFEYNGKIKFLEREEIIKSLVKKDFMLESDLVLNTGKLKEKLLKYDKNRVDIEEYDEKIIIDPNRGSWDLWDMAEKIKDNEKLISLECPLIGRNPKVDIKKSGVVGIDFGTKSTVVVYQENNNYTMPMRIGIGKIGKAVEEYHYENPTVMEFINIDEFMKMYEEKDGRPETRWSDLTISHTANNSFLNSSSEHYYSYFNELKQWCGNKDKKIRIKDKSDKVFDLPSFLEIKEGEFNPIEIYAYYLGTYINNMYNGIYLKYIMSFPVTYEKEIKEKVIKSFQRGISKSFPNSIINNSEIMEKFKIIEGANEPAAYAISALQAYEFEPEEKEDIFYGVFDFGGGTTDFDFGIWRVADEEKEDRYDYVIEHFGAGGDRYLGGENLLELLAFEIFKDNAEILREKHITFLLPPECRKFPGAEILLSESEEAKLNIRQLKEILRPITEQHENYVGLFESESIRINLYDTTGKQITNVELNINLDEIENILRERIEKGIRNFFEALRLSFKSDLANNTQKINIFLAGNSSKSKLVKDIFEEYIKKEESKIAKGLEIESIFEIYPALGTEDAYEKQEALGIKVEKNNLGKPTGKTGVAFGLIDSRKGSTIKVINRDIEQVEDKIKFKFFIGRQRRKKFKVVIDKNIEYNKWTKFIDAMEDEFEVYYTALPEASTNDISITDMERICLSIEEINEDANIYIRVIEPTVIEYVVALENDIENEEYLSGITRIRLE